MVLRSKTVPVLAMHLSTYNSRALAKIWRNYLYSTKNQKLMKTRELHLRLTNSSESFIQLQTQSKHTSHFLPVRRRRRLMITYCTQVAIHLHTFIEQSTMLVIYEAKNAPVHKIAPNTLPHPQDYQNYIYPWVCPHFSYTQSASTLDCLQDGCVGKLFNRQSHLLIFHRKHYQHYPLERRN